MGLLLKYPVRPTYPVRGTSGLLPEIASASTWTRVQSRGSSPQEPSRRTSTLALGLAIPRGFPGASDRYRVPGTLVVLGTSVEVLDHPRQQPRALVHQLL